MRLRALLPLLSLPVAVGLAVWSQPFAATLHASTALPTVPTFKFAIAREDLVPNNPAEDEELESIDYKALTPAAYVVSDDSSTGFSTIDRRPIGERFRLLSVLMGAQGSSALVDQRVVHVGDWLGGYKIVSITRDGLNLRGPRGRERLGFLSNEELAEREVPFSNEVARSVAAREKAAEVSARKGEKERAVDVAEPAEIRAQMESDYQRLLKDLKP